jgi:sensor domain CHASE-containing protein
MGTYYASLIISDFNKVYGEAAATQSLLKELQHTNASLLSMRTNALLKNILVAIIIATILIVISLFIWH